MITPLQIKNRISLYDLAKIGTKPVLFGSDNHIGLICSKAPDQRTKYAARLVIAVLV